MINETMQVVNTVTTLTSNEIKSVGGGDCRKFFGSGVMWAVYGAMVGTGLKLAEDYLVPTWVKQKIRDYDYSSGIIFFSSLVTGAWIIKQVIFTQPTGNASDVVFRGSITFSNR